MFECTFLLDMAHLYLLFKQFYPNLLICGVIAADKAVFQLGLTKRKGVFVHAQNAQIQSSRACAKPHPGICSALIHSIVSNDSVSRQHKPWSDCADAQADRGLRCPYMPEDTFSHGVAHLLFSLQWLNFMIKIQKTLKCLYFLSVNIAWHFIKLSPKDTTCLECQTLYSGENGKWFHNDFVCRFLYPPFGELNMHKVAN